MPPDHPEGARVPRELHDGFGRGINYLRISVTDKCNFRCVYCMPEEGVAMRAHDELLSAEEVRSFRAARRSRGHHARAAHRGRTARLAPHRAPHRGNSRHRWHRGHLPHHQRRPAPSCSCAALREAGLDRVNISLYTLNADRFTQITPGPRRTGVRRHRCRPRIRLRAGQGQHRRGQAYGPGCARAR